MEKEIIEHYLNRLETAFQMFIRRLHSELAQNMVKGITGSQFFVLKRLGERGRLTVSEVAEDIGVSLSAITALVDRLYKGGFVSRQRDGQDRRLVWLELTPAGEEILRKCQESRMKVIGHYFSRLPAGDIENLIAIYERLIEVMGQDDPRKDGPKDKGPEKRAAQN